MSQVFGVEYARHYDALYRDKHYGAEVELLERTFRESGLRDAQRVLDLGCGTGEHAIRLAHRRYDVTGVDRSAEMLAIARAKAERIADLRVPRPSFVEGDITKIRVGGPPFDAALMMFAVLSYQVTDDEVRAALGTVRAHLRDDGVFACDVWYGPAVLAQRPRDRIKTVESNDSQVVRTAETTLDVEAHRVDVLYHLKHMRGGGVLAETSETHPVRFFFPGELEGFFEASRLRLLELRAFRTDGVVAPASDATWSVLAVARAI